MKHIDVIVPKFYEYPLIISRCFFVIYILIRNGLLTEIKRSNIINKKYQKILNNFEDSKKEKVLEIGCGWGGFFSYASNFFKEIDSITISKEQFNYSSSISRKIDNVNVGYLDYRDVKGKYDLIVSIEMFEAVGQGYWDTYFKKVNDLLVKGGKAVIQTITIRDDLFDNYSSNTDAIRSLIFPGGMLPSPSKFIRYAQDLSLIHI